MLKIRDKAGTLIGTLKDQDNAPSMDEEFLKQIKDLMKDGLSEEEATKKVLQEKGKE